MNSTLQKLWNGFEKFVRAVVGFFLRLVKVELTEEQWEKFLQFVKFCLVGLSNTIVDFAVYTVVLLLLHASGWNGVLFGAPYWDVNIATGFGFFSAMLNSFYWNRRYVFSSESGASLRRIFIKVFVTYLLIFFMKLGLNQIWCGVLNIPELLINPLNQVIAIPISFLLNKYWAYR